MALMFCFLVFWLRGNTIWEGMPLFFQGVRSAAWLVFPALLPTFFHFFLVFPERHYFIRKFPQIEWLIYLPLPFLLYYPVLLVLSLFNFNIDWNQLGAFIIFKIIISLTGFYLFGGLIVLLLNYISD